MDAAFGGAGSPLTIHAEAFAGGAQDRQQQDGEGVAEQEAVVAAWIVDPERAQPFGARIDPPSRLVPYSAAPELRKSGFFESRKK